MATYATGLEIIKLRICELEVKSYLKGSFITPPIEDHNLIVFITLKSIEIVLYKYSPV